MITKESDGFTYKCNGVYLNDNGKWQQSAFYFQSIDAVYAALSKKALIEQNNTVLANIDNIEDIVNDDERFDAVINSDEFNDLLDAMNELIHNASITKDIDITVEVQVSFEVDLWSTCPISPILDSYDDPADMDLNYIGDISSWRDDIESEFDDIMYNIILLANKYDVDSNALVAYFKEQF